MYYPSSDKDRTVVASYSWFRMIKYPLTYDSGDDTNRPSKLHLAQYVFPENITLSY